MWRNWQTRCVQGAVPARECGFESHHRYHLHLPCPVATNNAAIEQVKKESWTNQLLKVLNKMPINARELIESSFYKAAEPQAK